MTDTDEDETRRRNEMNMFAMMAGGADDSFNSNSIAIHKPLPDEDVTATNEELNNAAALFSDEVFEAPKLSSSVNNMPMRQSQTEGMIQMMNNNNNNNKQSPSMFAEKIVMPRPLFFGSSLPKFNDGDTIPPNVQNALEFFSMANVSTYQPNFISRDESLQDYRRLHQKKPDIIARVSTAPPRLSPPSSATSVTVTPAPFDYSSMKIPEESLDDSDSFLVSLTAPSVQYPEELGPLSDQEKFSQWALMGSSTDMGLGMSGESLRFSTGTIKRHTSSVFDSDDDSMIEDEQKTKVGASDNLNKAIALLTDDGVPAAEVETSQLLLSQVAPDGSRKRPLTNYELTEGCTPLFAADDPPLPQESDLGIHETREEQQKSMEKKRAHEMIDKFVPPNVFGSVSCPNVAKHPDDCRSTRSKKTGRSRSPIKPPKSRKDNQKSPRHGSDKTRFGWWNALWVEEKAEEDSLEMVEDSHGLQLPPIHHSASSGLHIYSPLEPTPEQLRKDNLPLSRMHSATSMIHTLPLLSDRPPSHRHLQIDTQAVAFPPIKEEIEPLFCSVAIYNVETVTGTSNKSPLPDLQRCGRVTEALYFDYHADVSVEQRCHNALWPYAGEHIGTRCGIFPIPSNLNVANLYAVLIVKKVVGSCSDDLDPYLKPGKNWTDVERFKASAAKDSQRNGQILIPFAFGVAPLLQVFGLDNPTTASSRAVQIPLFHYSSSEKQIINHIMYMLFPRADHSGAGGPAAVTNGGTAMLVMRNFGYLGLHTAVNKSSVLARDRLVDFTGSFQLRRRTEDRPKDPETQSYVVCLPPWRHEYVAEQTTNGGRAKAGVASIGGNDSTSRLYAQELALWPILMAPLTRIPHSTQSGISSVRCQQENEDIEPSFHTSFCNELLCHPRILHNAPKGRLALKVELREVEWNAVLNAYCAHEISDKFVRTGIHNHRRGPPLVRFAFTSCTPERHTHHFIEDFKIRLPLKLDAMGDRRRLSLFFTVYRVKVGPKAVWKAIFSNSTADEREGDQAVCSGRVIRLACGFLPLSVGSGCLPEDGVHDVSISYKAVIPSAEALEDYDLPASSLILQEISLQDEPGHRDDSTFLDDLERDMDASVATETTDGKSVNDDTYSMRSRTRREPLSLSVRTVAHSSLHSHNAHVNRLLSYRRDETVLSYSHNKRLMASLRMGRDFIITNSKNPSPSETFSSDESLLQSIIGLGNSQLCPPRVSVAHLPRLSLALWRNIIVGDGQASLEWANPSTSPPLRVHAFVTLLHLTGSASVFMAKYGSSNVDGSEKFNVVNLGRMLALLFDEETLFHDHALEAFDHEYWRNFLDSVQSETSPSSKKTQPRKKRHVRSTYDLASEIPSRPSKSAHSQISSTSSSAGDLATMPKPKFHEEWSDAFDFSGFSSLSAETPKQPKEEPKLDSKSDFQSFLRAAVAEDSDDDDVVVEKKAVKSNDLLQAQAKSFGSSFAGQGRRFFTLPANALTPIMESEHSEDINQSFYERQGSQSSISNISLDGLSAEISEVEPQEQPQMRRPNLKKPIDEPSQDGVPTPGKGGRNLVPLQSDDQIESMGTAFLDTIAEDMLKGALTPSKDGDEPRVGSSHHRRRTNGGWSSIDWSLTADERVSSPTAPSEEEVGSDSGYDESNDAMVSLRDEEKSTVRMPGFADRLVTLGDSPSSSGRWFPFAYEVIIMQWSAVLSDPDRRNDRRSSAVAEASSRAVGVAIAAAPMLFETMKQSIGFRAKCLFKEVLSKGNKRESPPLIALDDTMLSSLCVIITKVTDACLDHNNFDSFDHLQMSTNVNDAIILFLRDLYGFLAPANVYNLIMIYFSRFATKDRPNSADRESALGLRCSWELARLRLNAVAAFVRFAEFARVNSPQMLGWDNWWASSPARSKGLFYDNILHRFEGYRLPQFSGLGDYHNKDILIGTMRPHWLAEVLVDVCLAGIEHAENKIQQKSAALLYEMMWSSSQESILSGIATPVASMYLTFIEKVLHRSTYLSNFSPKSQLRRDVLTCLVYVLQSTSPDLLRAVWRRLCTRLNGEGSGVNIGTTEQDEEKSPDSPPKEGYSILDMFALLNLALRTLEYDGCDEVIDVETTSVTKSSLESWRRDFLPSKLNSGKSKKKPKETIPPSLTTCVSRQWQAHDGSIVIVRIVSQIVRELYNMLSKSTNGKTLLNPAIRNGQKSRDHSSDRNGKSNDTSRKLDISRNDAVIFIRGATSVYLHSLSLQESDVVFEKTFVYSAEIIKIFGIRLFLEAVGETLQHWMRVISFHCGARRSQVRIAATDLLELILRSTWECFGSFFRIRVPLLAVQTEVMERMVALAAARYFKEQRRLGTHFEPFNNLGAEASLVPLWRTLDRIENNPASQNVAFRGALVRIAGKLKKLYRAYVAARALSFIRPGEKSECDERSEASKYESDPHVRAIRINILRVLNASEGFTRQFLSMQGTAQTSNRVAHYEAVEDALLDAANVFSPTELPEHRVAWLRMLAQFHCTRQKHAEEAACRYLIHVTLRLAARLHGSLWSNTPFLPWTDDIPDPIEYIDAEASQTGDVDCHSDVEGSEWDYGSQYGYTNSFRRIFYRVATSVRDHNLVWDTGINKNLFFGVTFAPEYSSVNPWLSLREMEESMIEEIEASGALFFKAGIVESSRCAWGLAAEYHTEKFNFRKLAMVYEQLSGAIVSKVSPIDTSFPQEVSTTFGRFYRVWLHGEAPDELRGIEFVYRSTTCLKEFGEEIRSVIKSIMPQMTPVHLVLDGLSEDIAESIGKVSHSGFRIGPAQLAPVSIKVTPLRPLFSRFSRTRGLPEWFHHYISERYTDSRPFHNRPNVLSIKSIATSVKGGDRLDPHHQHNRSFSATVFSSTGSTGITNGSRKSLANPFLGETDRSPKAISPRKTDLLGVDKFCFVQPIDHSHQKEWWKTGNFVSKCLRVFELQVAEPFPACVARQKVIQRDRYNQSPLEAAIDALCQWCAVLYRTAVATTGITHLGMSNDPGIGTEASKIVADCIHNSHVKEIASTMLTDSGKLLDMPGDADCLGEDEIYKLQLKLARLVVTFIELLHILISRNRDELLEVIKERKKDGGGGRHHQGSSANSSRVFNRAHSLGPRDTGPSWPPNGGPPSIEQNPIHQRQKSDVAGLRPEERRKRVTTGGSEDNHSYHSTMTNPGVRTDSAIAVQSELQRSFISLTKSLHKKIQFVMREDTPSWLSLCSQEYYFSRGTYRSNRMPIVDELCFQSFERSGSGMTHEHEHTHHLNNTSLHSEQGYESPRAGSVSGQSYRSYNSNSGLSRTSGRVQSGENY